MSRWAQLFMIREMMFGCVFSHSHNGGKDGRLEKLLLKWSRKLLLFWLLLQSCTPRKNVSKKFLILQQYLKIEVYAQGAKVRGSSFSSRQRMTAPLEPQTIRVEYPLWLWTHMVVDTRSCALFGRFSATSGRVGAFKNKGVRFLEGGRFQNPSVYVLEASFPKALYS